MNFILEKMIIEISNLICKNLHNNKIRQIKRLRGHNYKNICLRYELVIEIGGEFLYNQFTESMIKEKHDFYPTLYGWLKGFLNCKKYNLALGLFENLCKSCVDTIAISIFVQNFKLQDSSDWLDKFLEILVREGMYDGNKQFIEQLKLFCEKRGFNEKFEKYFNKYRKVGFYKSRFLI